MDLQNIKELEKLLKMCRKQGITELTMKDMAFKFGDLPRESVESEDLLTIPNQASDEDMIYWSSQPDPLAGANQ